MVLCTKLFLKTTTPPAQWLENLWYKLLWIQTLPIYWDPVLSEKCKCMKVWTEFKFSAIWSSHPTFIEWINPFKKHPSLNELFWPQQIFFQKETKPDLDDQNNTTDSVSKFAYMFTYVHMYIYESSEIAISYTFLGCLQSFNYRNVFFHSPYNYFTHM